MKTKRVPKVTTAERQRPMLADVLGPGDGGVAVTVRFSDSTRVVVELSCAVVEDVSL